MDVAPTIVDVDLGTNATLVNLKDLPPQLSQDLQEISEDGKTRVSTLEQTAINLKQEKETKPWLWHAIYMLLALVVVQSWATFGMSFWAVNLVKDSQAVEMKSGSTALTANDRTSVMETATSKAEISLLPRSRSRHEASQRN